MKQYVENLRARFLEPNSWPGVALNESFNELQAKAQSAVEAKTLEGYLAGMLLIHQIAEDLLRVLEEEAIFFTQLRLYPYPYNPPRRKRRMFGQVLQDMEAIIWFPNKKYILERAEKLNRIRVPIVHGLTQPGAMEAVAKSVEEAWKIYCSFSWLAVERHLCFHREFFDLQDEGWPPKDVAIMNEDGSYEAPH